MIFINRTILELVIQYQQRIMMITILKAQNRFMGTTKVNKSSGGKSGLKERLLGSTTSHVASYINSEASCKKG